ncbi:hypothetical protein [Actinoplanes teichomyceticus]|uniref:Uncharacterized protein n=1 Tax=Actinoplanes teichomyceticus TaxID=1867 RepID=A0A561WIV2_ACTTI|nr:hypothetical protein [Actinoplanes teichomyceticus]TWG23740.1 hypothetical protein FHX34_102291 [Actinoplanes teichomyceticus]GIF11781.1 hypothetical protein Ate01nite_18130 [Actinoplanes teichomyceticus]
MSIRFFRNSDNRRTFEVESKRFAPLGSQLINDIQGYSSDCIDLLDCIDEVAAGRAEYTEYEGTRPSSAATRRA